MNYTKFTPVDESHYGTAERCRRLETAADLQYRRPQRLTTEAVT
jgi:hypothetical protein